MEFKFGALFCIAHLSRNPSFFPLRTDDYELEEEVLVSSTAIDEEVRGLFQATTSCRFS
jgi:hypothetical protein